MKKQTLALLLGGIILLQSGLGQSGLSPVPPTQEQLQTADQQLNQVYQELRSALNDAQKQQLKLAQRAWIKKRDAIVAANPNNPQGALYQSTIQRIEELRGLSGQQVQAQRTQVQSHEACPTQQQYGVYQQQGVTHIASVTDDELSKADTDLNKVYQQLMQSLENEQRIKLQEGQRGWIKRRNEIVSQQQNQRFATKYLAEDRITELQVRILDPYKAAIKDLSINYNKYLTSLPDNEQQRFLATEGIEYEKEIIGYSQDKDVNKIISYKDRILQRLSQQKLSNNTLGITEVALQKMHKVSVSNHKINISAVFLKKPDVVVTAYDREIKVWEAKTGKLLRDIPVSSIVDWIFPSTNENNIVAISIDRKWSGGERREIDVTNGDIIDTKDGEGPFRGDVAKISRVGLTCDQFWTVQGHRDGNTPFLKANDYIQPQDSVLINDLNLTGEQLQSISGVSKLRINQINFYYNLSYNKYILRINDKYLLADKSGGKISTILRLCSPVEARSLLSGINEQNSYNEDFDQEELFNDTSTAKNRIFPYSASGNAFSNDENRKISIAFKKDKPQIYIGFEDGKKIDVAEINDESQNPTQVALSSGGERILVALGNKLVGLDLKDTKRTFLVTSATTNQIINPTISNDGKAFCYTEIDIKKIHAGGSYMASPLNDINNLGTTIISSWNNPLNYMMQIDESVIQGFSYKINKVAIISSNTIIIDLNNPKNIVTLNYKPDRYSQIYNNGVYDKDKSCPRTEFVYPLDSNSLKSFKEGLVSEVDNSSGRPINTNRVSFDDLGFWDNWVIDYDSSYNNDQLVTYFGKAIGGTYLIKNNPYSRVNVPLRPSCIGNNIASTTSRWINENNFFIASTEGLITFNQNAQPVSFWRSPVSYPHGPYPGINRWSFDINSKKLAFASPDDSIHIFKISDDLTLDSLLHIYFNFASEPIYLTPDNFYATHSLHSDSIAFTQGVHSYPLEQFDLRLNRPDIVLERLGAPKESINAAKALREKRLKRMGVTEEMLKPDFHLPEIQIVGDVPTTANKDQIDLKIKAADDKYPLDRLRVYVNNVPVNGRDGELLRDANTQSLEKSIPIKLAAGRNKIQISVLNSAGAESFYANAEVNCTAERPKPKLYAVALGVSQYDRPEWCLKYAAKDASDLINKIKEKAGSSYSEVKPLLLTDKEVTKESVAKIKNFLSGATIDDTVLIFMAGHGILDDKYDYYFGTTDIDPAKPFDRGMPYEAVDKILAEVPSLNKALLMDTCHAGELDEDEKKELAAADGKGAPLATDSSLKGKVAMRSIGARGMTVNAIQGGKGKSDWYEKLQDMFVDLRRGSGATVISSSQGAEYAFESSEQSNGLFTYALMEALDGKAAPKKDGQITISTVGDYVKKRVQDLTKGKQNPNLRGVNLEEDFALSSTK